MKKNITIVILWICFWSLFLIAGEPVQETLDPLTKSDQMQEVIMDWVAFFWDLATHPAIVAILGLFGISFIHPKMREAGGKTLEAVKLKKPTIK